MKNQTKRVMKLTFITLFLSTTGMFASVNSQNTRVNIHVNNANTQIVLNEIEKQTDYLFVYDTKEIDLNRKVSVEAQNKTVADVLSSVFTQTDISYAMEGNNIMLMRKNTSVTQQSNRRITGVVKDAIGEPIIGANIVEKGTTNGIITDINGNFSLMVSENAILQISYIGYQTQEIPTKGQTNIQITMKDDAQALDDVVVIGYGAVKKSDLTSSIAAIKDGKVMLASNESMAKMVGQVLQFRSPMLCKTKGLNYCGVCVGSVLASRPNALHTTGSNVGSVFMLAAMKSMHGKALKTKRFNFTNAIS